MNLNMVCVLTVPTTDSIGDPRSEVTKDTVQSGKTDQNFTSRCTVRCLGPGQG